MNYNNNGKTFKVLNEHGTCYSFTMHADSTVEDAKRFANTWNKLAGETAKIVKVWEISASQTI